MEKQDCRCFGFPIFNETIIITHIKQDEAVSDDTASSCLIWLSFFTIYQRLQAGIPLLQYSIVHC